MKSDGKRNLVLNVPKPTFEESGAQCEQDLNADTNHCPDSILTSDFEKLHLAEQVKLKSKIKSPKCIVKEKLKHYYISSKHCQILIRRSPDRARKMSIGHRKQRSVIAYDNLHTSKRIFMVTGNSPLNRSKRIKLYLA